MLSSKIGNVFANCEIVEESEHHYYLIRNQENQWFDIVLPKYHDDLFDDQTQFLNLKLNIGDVVTVKVYTINIADDGFPGAFVTLVNHENGFHAEETDSGDNF